MKKKKPKADFELSYIFEAPPLAVYNALTTQVGVRGWWTECCVVSPTVGAHAAFVFPYGNFFAVMKILTLKKNKLVEWRCLEGQHDEKAGFRDRHDWVGTKISFRLKAIGRAETQLQFTHHKLGTLESHGACASIWAYFLGQSLRQMLRTGRGMPATV
ncbi:MAG: SRPBCC domain-containing protein [Opitutus sp.]|nr:SRPBCC domain-containing protein [Opitutus sp.]